MKDAFYISGKKIDLNECAILYNRPFCEDSLREDFDAVSGEWSVDCEGYLTGLIHNNAGGMLYSKKSYSCDVFMEFWAKTVPPCSNDLNFVYKTCGWDNEKNDAGKGYIVGLGGWWVNKAGIEKYPVCKPAVMTPLFKLEAGREYHIVSGCIDGHCFLFADGQLIIEMFDPTPEDFFDCGKFGFGTYASHIKYRNLTLYKANYKVHSLSY